MFAGRAKGLAFDGPERFWIEFSGEKLADQPFVTAFINGRRHGDELMSEERRLGAYFQVLDR
jgi:hypothetical protein